MLSFQTLYTRAADIAGISLTTNTQDLTNIQMDINQGLRLFKNASRRYWTRAEKSAGLVANQQYYLLPTDLVRVTEVKVISNGLTFPLTQIDSEAIWNKQNIIPSMTINLPLYYFIKGNGEIGLWPVPSQTTSNSLVVSYEPRLQDMSINDVTSTVNGLSPTVVTATVTNGTTTVTFSGNIITSSMVGRWFTVNDGSDGNWYQISIFNSSSSFELVGDYQGISGGSHTFVIGQAPDIPEDYHLGLVYYAAYQYYLKRSDNESAMLYKSLFEDLLTQYKEVYAAKSTGQVQNDMGNIGYNILTIPPTNLT